MRIWIDSDMGFDDLWAILTARSLGIQIDGMSLVAGISRLPLVVRNANAAASAFSWNFPIFEGAASALLGGTETAERVLGQTGIRSRGKELPVTRNASVQPGAFEAMREWIASGRNRTLLAMGPLTNVAIVVRANPELAGRIERVVWMGGSAGQGNHTPAAEFNAFADPEAVEVLLSAPVAMTIVDLEICRKVRFDESDIRQIAGMDGQNAALLADLAGGYLDIALERGMESMAIYDPVAAVALACPHRFAFMRSSVEVLFTGSQRGRTKVIAASPGEENGAEVAIDTDHEAVRRSCLDALKQECSR